MTAQLDYVVSTDWLAAHRNDDDLIVVDVRPAEQYAAGHIPDARHIDLYPMKILDSDPELVAGWVRSIEAAARQLGLEQDSRVVFYEDFSGTTAARGVWLMHALSLGSGAMLDGGLSAWAAAGHPLNTTPVATKPSTITATLDPALFATADEIRSGVENGQDATIIDTRGDVEWAQGTIPTAIHLEWVHHLNPDGTFKSLDELRALYEDHGALPDGETITFCASGYRAAHTWVVLRMLGYENVRNYAPSWGEWGRRDDLPIAPTR